MKKILVLSLIFVLCGLYPACNRADVDGQGAGKKAGSGEGRGKRMRGQGSDASYVELEKRVARLEERMAQLDQKNTRRQVTAEYTQVAPKELANNPDSYEGKKIRFMGKIDSIDADKNIVVISRGENKIKVDVADIDAEQKTELLKPVENNDNLGRMIAMGVFKGGVMKADKVRLLRRGGMRAGRGGARGNFGEDGARGKMRGGGRGGRQ